LPRVERGIEFRGMRAGERERVLELLELAFGTREVFERYFDHDPELGLDDTLLALADGRPVACVQTFSRPIRVRRHELRLGGIGSVATHPDWRSRALASRLLDAALMRLRALDRPLALLFTTRFGFYERLGFRQVSQRMFRLREPTRGGGAHAGIWMRAFEPGDLARVRELYAGYCDGLSGCTVRDAGYWNAQLRFATSPSGSFVVGGNAERCLAYLRCDELEGRRVAVEYARERGAAGVLAELLLREVPAGRSLFAPIVPDPELGQALRACGAVPEPAEDPMPMWCVLGREALTAIAGLPSDASERSILDALIGGPSAVFWPSDRF
jgi:predicted N-acetyltransferase YhbS